MPQPHRTAWLLVHRRVTTPASSRVLRDSSTQTTAHLQAAAPPGSSASTPTTAQSVRDAVRRCPGFSAPCRAPRDREWHGRVPRLPRNTAAPPGRICQTAARCRVRLWRWPTPTDCRWPGPPPRLRSRWEVPARRHRDRRSPGRENRVPARAMALVLRPSEADRFIQMRVRNVVLALEPRQRPCTAKRLHARGAAVARRCKGRLEPSATLAPLIGMKPPPPQRCGEAQGASWRVSELSIERGPEVVALRRQRCDRMVAAVAGQEWPPLGGKLVEERRMSVAKPLTLLWVKLVVRVLVAPSPATCSADPVCSR